jgi:hypothetical protein
MTFSHLLARIRVRAFTYEHPDSIENYYGKIDSIFISSATTCTVTLPAVNAATNTKPIPAYLGNDTLPLIRKDTTNTVIATYEADGKFLVPNITADDGTVGLAGYVMIAPASEFGLKIKTEKRTITATIKASFTPFVYFGAGKSYSLALDFGVSVPITVTLGQQEWDEGDITNVTNAKSTFHLGAANWGNGANTQVY